MKFTYYGHSCFEVETNGKKILFDPFISHNDLAKHIHIESINPDFIFLSHGHTDHIADCTAIAKRTGCMVICSWEIYEWLQKRGLTNLHPMNTGGKWNFDFGSIKCVVAQHSSGLPDGSYGGSPMGCIIESKEGTFYYSGDTALTLDMQLIPLWAKLDYAVLCIGDNFTMGVSDAIRSAEMIQCKRIIGVHYNTFGYIKINTALAKTSFAEAGKELLLPEIGETINV
jgi:L-ascorbate metabolism protein UlaG (beta-lactamase superfamily)